MSVASDVKTKQTPPSLVSQVLRWRPIETAPKDGTEIIGLDERYDLAFVRWHEELGWLDRWTDDFSPVAWMSAPAVDFMPSTAPE